MSTARASPWPGKRKSKSSLGVDRIGSSTSAPSSLQSREHPSLEWAAELAAGHFAAILQRAEQRGLERSLDEQRLDVALTWYERCLSESPGGTYTSEALGRKMTVVGRLYGASRARPIAEEYLRRFENGTYAAAARALIRVP